MHDEKHITAAARDRERAAARANMPPRSPSSTGTFQVCVKTLSGKDITLKVESDDTTVDAFKVMIQKKEGGALQMLLAPSQHAM